MSTVECVATRDPQDTPHAPSIEAPQQPYVCQVSQLNSDGDVFIDDSFAVHLEVFIMSICLNVANTLVGSRPKSLFLL